MSLHFGATFAFQALKLRFSFHPLGRRRNTERAAKACDCANDRDRIALVSQVVNERLVDLDLVERESTQVTQARISSAEVVHRDADTEVAQLRENGYRHFSVLEQHSLRNLDFEPTAG